MITRLLMSSMRVGFSMYALFTDAKTKQPLDSVILTVTDNMGLMVIAYFEKIRKEILTLLDNSNEKIRIAVAWFTNEELFHTLLECLNRNVKVDVVTYPKILFIITKIEFLKRCLSPF